MLLNSLQLILPTLQLQLQAHVSLRLRRVLYIQNMYLFSMLTAHHITSGKLDQMVIFTAHAQSM